MTKIKICGITNIDDAETAIEAGADALGFVFYKKSPRCVSPADAGKIISRLGPFVLSVGVFVNAPAETINAVVEEAGLDRVQLHGDEPASLLADLRVPAFKAFRVRGVETLDELTRYNCRAFLLDAFSTEEYGGTGETFDWNVAAKAAKQARIVLSGGLGVHNVAEAIDRVRPYGVDVSSGVGRDDDKRRKDPVKIRRFIQAVRSADEKRPSP